MRLPTIKFAAQLPVRASSPQPWKLWKPPGRCGVQRLGFQVEFDYCRRLVHIRCVPGSAFVILRGVFQKEIRITNRDTILSTARHAAISTIALVRHIDKDRLGCPWVCTPSSFAVVFHDTSIHSSYHNRCLGRNRADSRVWTSAVSGVAASSMPSMSVFCLGAC